MADELLAGLREEDLKISLAPSVRKAVDTLERRNLNWNQIGFLLADTPSQPIALKGGGDQSSDLWPAIKEEFTEFICSDTEKYQELRAKWNDLREQSVPVAVASLAATIGAHIGIAGGMIAPVVVWLLITVYRIGIGAFCQIESKVELNESSEPTENVS